MTYTVYGTKNDGNGEKLVFRSIDETALQRRGMETARAAGFIALRCVPIWSPVSPSLRPWRELYLKLN